MHFLADLMYGSFVGLALGMTGGGGSIVTLPILVYLVGEKVHDAIGTSLAVVAGISLVGMLHQRTGLDWRTGALLGALGILGAVPGALLAKHVPGNTLLFIFAGVMIVAAIAMLRVRRTPINDGGPPKIRELVSSGVALGFLTGFLGVGGGFLIVPTLIIALRFTIQRAIPTSLMVIAFNSLVSLATRVAISPVDWNVVLAFLIGGAIGNVVGFVVARSLDQRRLKQVFAVFVICVGIFTGGSAAGIIPVTVH